MERVAFYDSENNQFMSLFKHIRCAFAHGRVGVKKTDQESMYLMEDGWPYKGRLKVSARMVLKKSTLLNWIKIIQDGPQEEENSYYVLTVPGVDLLTYCGANTGINGATGLTVPGV